MASVPAPAGMKARCRAGFERVVVSMCGDCECPCTLADAETAELMRRTERGGYATPLTLMLPEPGDGTCECRCHETYKFLTRVGE